MFSKSSHHSLLDRTPEDFESQDKSFDLWRIQIGWNKETKKQPARAADGEAHLVVAAKAVELVQLVRRVAGARSHLSGEKKSWKHLNTKP